MLKNYPTTSVLLQSLAIGFALGVFITFGPKIIGFEAVALSIGIGGVLGSILYAVYLDRQKDSHQYY